MPFGKSADIAPVQETESNRPAQVEGAVKGIWGNDETKSPEYILGPGDTIEITVYRHDELTKTILIGPSGKIIYPLLGEVTAAGLSISALTEKIKEGLSRYIIDPKAGVNVISVQSQTVTVLGEVNKPGFYPLDRPLTILDAISMAGGFTVKANQNNILLIRKGLEKPDLKTLNLKKAIKQGDITSNVALQNGDIICVPESLL
ncbi:polysaccharide export protein [bacterium]|nr:polysaccharide export protein [bacterium]